LQDKKVWEENQEKKKYLSGYKAAKKKEERILEQIQELRTNAMFPALQYDDMPRGTNISDLSDYAAKLDELIRELKQERLEAIKKYEKIYQDIKCVEDEREQDVLTYRYLQCMDWEAVCVAMGLSWKHTHRIHGNALKTLEMT